MTAIAVDRPEPGLRHSAVDPKAVVFLVGSLGIGGAERQAIAIAGELKRMGNRVAIISLADGPLRQMVVLEGVELHVVGRTFGFSPAAVNPLARLLRTISPDVVYAFLEVQWLLALAAVRINSRHRSPRPKVVFGLRTGSYRKPTAGVRQRTVHELACRGAAHADLLIANSSSGLEDFRSRCHGSPPGVVIPNGIDVSTLAPAPHAGAALRASWGIASDALVIGHVGRLSEVKDHETLIDSFALLAATDIDARLVCVGEGTETRRQSLVQRAETNGIADRVRFTGARSDLAAVYSAFDVLALSSVREGFANVIAEAMACGVPAVVTDTGASREIVGEFGEVVPVGNAHEFATAVHRLLSRRSPALALACRQRILDNYTLQHCASLTLDAFASLTTSPS